MTLRVVAAACRRRCCCAARRRRCPRREAAVVLALLSRYACDAGESCFLVLAAVARATPVTRYAWSAVPRRAVPTPSNCSASLRAQRSPSQILLSKDKRDHENARVRVRRSTENASSVNGRCGRSHPLSTQPVRRPASAQRRDARRTRTPSLRRYDARTKAFYRNRTTRPTHA